MTAAAAAPTAIDLLADWHLDPGPTLIVLAAAAAYLLGVRRLARPPAARHPAARARWPRHRTAAYLCGLAALLASLASGLDAHADDLLSVHMVQHVALAMVAAPLIVLGAPLALALRALDARPRRTLAAVARSRAARLLSHPLLAWTGFAGVTIATHLTPLYDAALRSAALHGLEHFLYLASGILFWLPVVGANPVLRRPGPVGRLLYLLLAMAPMALVGVALLTAEEVLYPAYLSPARALGVSPLADQDAAALIMWIGGNLLLAAAILALVWESMLREERRQVAREAHA